MYNGDTEDDYFEALSTYRECRNSTPPPIAGILDPDLLSPRQSPPEIPAVKSGLLLPQLAAPSDSAKGKGKIVENTAFPSPENSNPNNSPLGLNNKSILRSPSSETGSVESRESAPTIANDQFVSEAQLQARDGQINQRFQELEEENRILKKMQNELQTSFDNLTQALQTRDSFSSPLTNFLDSNQWAQNQASNTAGQQVAMQQTIFAQAGSSSFPPQIPTGSAGSMRPPPQVPGAAPKRRKGNKENSIPSNSPALSPNTMARKLTSLSHQANPGPSHNHGTPQSGNGSLPLSPEVFSKFQQLTELIKKKRETTAQYNDNIPANLQANFNKEFKALWSSVGKDDAETIRKLLMYHNTCTPAASPRAPLAPMTIQVNGSSPIQSTSSTNSENFIFQSPMQLQNNYPTQPQFSGNNLQGESMARSTPQIFGTMNGQGHTSSPQNNMLGGSGYMQGYQFHEEGQTIPQQIHSPYMNMQPQNMYQRPVLGQQMGLGLGQFQGHPIDPALLNVSNQQPSGYQMPTRSQWQGSAPQIQIPSQQEIDSLLMQNLPQKYTPQLKQKALSRVSSANSTPRSSPRSTTQGPRKSGGKKNKAGDDEDYILGQ
ncbi:hypothetical protein L211DRAFT_851260 [Terfezia boudieri ATCC MYA-4762]|uniref:Uncharacterized protein n=1 Tax=Terfezia boudieri ATCC MYA-4762 TaxID=1051890 RepID=A0A3N4LJD0_9PEZI|nr:hypothetical protein L211DRAFT_851260 [Terfezia boudieri ATCC MYA-4762]